MGGGHFLFLVQNYVAGFIMDCIDHVLFQMFIQKGGGAASLLVVKLIQEGRML